MMVPSTEMTFSLFADVFKIVAHVEYESQHMRPLKYL